MKSQIADNRRHHRLGAVSAAAEGQGSPARRAAQRRLRELGQAIFRTCRLWLFVVRPGVGSRGSAGKFSVNLYDSIGKLSSRPSP